jgi:large subunit ribosomal protein L31
MTLRYRLLKQCAALAIGFPTKSRRREEETRSGQPDLRSRSDGVIAAAIERAAGPPDGSLLISPEMRRMKSDIHPKYHMIKVVMTNGDEFTTRSTYGEEGATLNLDIDPNTHPAWTGGSQQLLDRGGRLSRFNTRFGGLGMGGKK